ncbi:MAG TPA: ankyrin repeat domain-containing protein [Pirellulales bacterium]|nr:ankyrin repeat domain-containing protein [Pirellulales bacterium]
MNNERNNDSSSATPQGPNRRFFQFTMRELLLVLVLSGVLLGLMTPWIRRRFHEWRLDEGFRKTAIADAELANAVRANDPSLARHALEAGAKPDLNYASLPTGFLHTCIIRGLVDMLKLLLDFGADVERTAHVSGRFQRDVHYGSPLFAAVECDQPPEVRCEMIRVLVAAGADPHQQEGEVNAMDVAFRLSDGQVADCLRQWGLPYGPREMAAFNRLEELKQAVRADPEILTKRFPTTWAAKRGREPTLLGIALRRGYREMSLFLIEAGAALDTIEHQGSTLLLEAARGGDAELVRLLLARGLDVDALDDYKDTPLCDIAGRKMPEVVAALIEAGADVNHQGMNRRTPLHGAVWSDRTDIVQMLLAVGADPTLADHEGETPLARARKRNPEIAELLEQATKPPAKGP